jgi:orotidine-5'-phosphate decarboxylase
MNRHTLVQEIRKKKSCLCVGLDLAPEKLPKHLGSGPSAWLKFNKAIIDRTKDYCVAYKPNWAFYEALGEEGMSVLKSTIDYIQSDHLIIADAKRGDIGNTSQQYSKAIFETFSADAITVAPYMGIDSLLPFRENGKWIIALALTSNPGSSDFQKLTLSSGEMLYEKVIKELSQVFSVEELMFVVGATHPSSLYDIRKLAPNHFFLVPGVGAQGGSVEDVCKNAMNEDVGLLINSSRSIIYASSDTDFAEKAGESARLLQHQMAPFIQ